MVVVVVVGLLGIMMVRPINYLLYTLPDDVAVEEVVVGLGIEEGVHEQWVAECHKSREEEGWIGDEKSRVVVVE